MHHQPTACPKKHTPHSQHTHQRHQPHAPHTMCNTHIPSIHTTHTPQSIQMHANTHAHTPHILHIPYTHSTHILYMHCIHILTLHIHHPHVLTPPTPPTHTHTLSEACRCHFPSTFCEAGLQNLVKDPGVQVKDMEKCLRGLWWSMIMREKKRMHTCMCNWVTRLYSRKKQIMYWGNNFF